MNRGGDGKQRNPGAEASRPRTDQAVAVEFEAAEFCRGHGLAAPFCI